MRADATLPQFALPDDNVTDGEAREFNVTDGRRAPKTAAATSRPTPASRDNDEVLQRDRDYSACSLNAEPDGVVHRLRRLGHELPGSTSTTGGACVHDRPERRAHVPPFDATTDLYNFGPANYYQRPDRATAWARWVTTTLTDADVYTQLMFTDYESIAQIAPGGDVLRHRTRSTATTRSSPRSSRRYHRLHAADVAAGTRDAVHRASATSKAAVASTASRTTRSARPGRRPRRDHRELGLRRVGAVLEGQDAITSTNNYFHIDASERSLNAVDGARTASLAPQRQRRFAARTVDADPSCVPYNHVQDRRRDARRRSITCRSPASRHGTIEQEVYHGVHDRRPRRHRVAEPVRLGEASQVAFGVEKRGSTASTTSRTTCSSTAQLSGTGGPTIGIRARRRCWISSPRSGSRWSRTRRSRTSSDSMPAYRYSDYDTDH